MTRKKINKQTDKLKWDICEYFSNSLSRRVCVRDKFSAPKRANVHGSVLSEQNIWYDWITAVCWFRSRQQDDNSHVLKGCDFREEFMAMRNIRLYGFISFKLKCWLFEARIYKVSFVVRLLVSFIYYCSGEKRTQKSDRRDLFVWRLCEGPADKNSRMRGKESERKIYGTMSMSNERLNEKKWTQFRINCNNGIAVRHRACVCPGLSSGSLLTTRETKDQHASCSSTIVNREMR